MRLLRALRGLFVLVAASALLTGCGLNTVVDIRLWDDRAMFLDLDMSVPEGTQDPRMLCTQLPPLGKLEPYTENGRAGCRVGGMSKTQALAELSPDSRIAVEDGELAFSMQDLISIEPGQEEQANADLADASAQVSVTFPGEVIEHSGASTLEGRTVTWTEMDDIREGLTARSDMPNRIIVPAVVGGVSLTATIVVLVWGLRGRSDSSRPAAQNAPPAGP